MGAPPLTVAALLADPTTQLSLLLVVLLLSGAHLLSLRALSRTTPPSLRLLFTWHVFDALIHFVFEGSFLYNCLFTFTALPPSAAPAATWLGRTDRLYGAAFAGPDNACAALWRVYAQADARWGGADATVVSIELLTVLGAGPLAVLVAWMIARRDARAGVWMVVLAAAELYGGFMTFVPEWLTGSQSLDTSNWMYTWVYLFFFNALWIVFPLYAMYVGYKDICNAFDVRNGVIAARLAEAKRASKEAR